MGPRSWDRGEMSAIPPARPAGSALQWGRGLGTAESADRRLRHDRQLPGFNGAAVLGPRREPHPETPVAHPRRFNGAAVLGPRRVSLRMWAGAPYRRLQWGRGLGTAESELRRDVAAHDIDASMGPRSWDRGETGCSTAAASRCWCFNGAAVLGPRRVGHASPDENRRGKASMGPRSWDRGETGQ